MSEQQVSAFTFIKENLIGQGLDCGGAYRVVTAEIVIDSEADERTQKIALVHEILGCYLGSIVLTDTLAEIAESIVDGLAELEKAAPSI